MHVSPASDSLLQMLEVRPLTLDDVSSARYVVDAAFSRAAPAHYTAGQVEAFRSYVRGPRYADVLLGNLTYAAWIGQQMVGLAVWNPGEGRSLTARLLGVFVDPLFAGHGVGTRLIEQVEGAAAAAGLRAVEASVLLGAAEYFGQFGYLEVRRGGLGLPSGGEIPVAVMRKTAIGRGGSVH